MRRSASASASGSFSGSLPPARAIVGRPPPPPADDRGGLAEDVGRADPLGDRRVEVRDEMHPAVLPRAEHDRSGRVLLLVPVGEVEQRVGVEPVDPLDDDVHAALGPHVRIGTSARSARCAAFGAFRSRSSSPRSDSSSRARSWRNA